MATSVVQYPSYPTYGFASVSLKNTIPAYLYGQYYDDDNLTAFVMAYNQYVQAYVDWFNNINLPIYTQPQISGALLDWVGQGIYGLPRPSIPSGIQQSYGPYNTVAYGMQPYAAWKAINTEGSYATSDDVYKRILTWHFYKGDGSNFNIKWLKRRIMRFLFGTNGTDYIIDETYPVSVTFTGSQVNIALTGEDPAMGAIFKAAVLSGVLELPFQFNYSVTV